MPGDMKCNIQNSRHFEKVCTLWLCDMCIQIEKEIRGRQQDLNSLRVRNEMRGVGTGVHK